MSAPNWSPRIKWWVVLAAAAMVALVVGSVIFIRALRASLPNTDANPGKMTYASGFTPEKFRHVSLGMTKAEVRRLLGDPIGRSEGPPAMPNKFPEIWYYSWAGGSDPIPERQHFVEFDTSGRVIGMAWPWEAASSQ